MRLVTRSLTLGLIRGLVLSQTTCFSMDGRVPEKATRKLSPDCALDGLRQLLPGRAQPQREGLWDTPIRSTRRNAIVRALVLPLAAPRACDRPGRAPTGRQGDSVDAFAPGTQHPRNPGFFHYGVHAVEIMYSLMGTGCRRVRCVRTEGVDVAVGEWGDGRVGTVRAIRNGAKQIGFTCVTEKQVITTKTSAYGYREVLKQIVQMFETKKSPMSGAELIEPVAFQEAALISMDRGGAAVDLNVVGLPV